MLPSIEYTNILANGTAQYAKDADRRLENSLTVEASKIRAKMKDNTLNQEQNDSDGKGLIKNKLFYTEEPPITTNLGNTCDIWNKIYAQNGVFQTEMT